MSTGKFCWFDLMSTDVATATAFYEALFGWKIDDHNAGYGMIHDRNGKGLGGIMAAQPGMPSAWLAYVTTDDVDATAAKVTELGGTIFVRNTAAGVGEFLIYADRQGAVLSAFRFDDQYRGENAGPYPREKGEAHICWAELHTNDPADALAFHQGVYGWKGETWGGDYILIGDEHAGGITRLRSEAPPHWLIYVNTPNTDATVARVKELGGHCVAGPMDIPNVGRFAVFMDPTNAVFAVMQNVARE